MAGRGRGKTSSLTQEQLQSLGCIGKDAPQVQTAPPPTFPPLMTKPVTLETTAAQNYQILWKEDFLSHMRDSPYYLTRGLDSKLTNARQYSDRFADADESSQNKLKTTADFNWQLMPLELQASQKKRRIVNNKKELLKKKVKTENIEDRLKKLEEKERTEKDGEVPIKQGSDSENEDEEEGEEQAHDEEMDDENDYGNSYFDNGESYNEEDDNLDDGPVY